MANKNRKFCIIFSLLLGWSQEYLGKPTEWNSIVSEISVFVSQKFLFVRNFCFCFSFVVKSLKPKLPQLQTFTLKFLLALVVQWESYGLLPWRHEFGSQNCSFFLLFSQFINKVLQHSDSFPGPNLLYLSDKKICF